MADVSKFRHVVKFENPTKAANTSGGQEETYAEFVTTRGYMRKSDGFRSLQDGYDAIVNNYRLDCYYRNDIENNLTRDTRVIYDNRSFRIDTWENLGEERMFMRFNLIEIR